MCTDGKRCHNCPAKRIPANTTLIAEALPALGTVVAVTANDAALLSHTGDYLPPAHPGEALRCDDRGIALRLNPGLVRDTFLTPRFLTMLADNGSHRAYLTPMSDQMMLRGLELAPAGEPLEVTPLDWSAVDWDDTDQIDHLDGLTAQRYRVLPFHGARRIETRVLPYLLAHLAEAGLPFTIAVPGGGCIQLHRGRAAMVQQDGAQIAAVFGVARYAMDPVRIAECWVTATHAAAGRTSSIELYDHSSRCVTVLTQTGPLCGHLHEAWEAIAASLPTHEG